MIMRFLSRWDEDVSIWIDLSTIIAISSDPSNGDFEINMATGSKIDDDSCFCVVIPQEGEELPEDAVARVIRAWVSTRMNRRA